MVDTNDAVTIAGMPAGVETSISYKISYGGMGQNIIGLGPESTIYVDTSGGAVGNWDISTTRIYNEVPNNASFVKGIIAEMTKNSLSTPPTQFTLHRANTKTGASKQFEGYISSATFSFDMTKPSTMSVSITIYKGKPNASLTQG